VTALLLVEVLTEFAVADLIEALEYYFEFEMLELVVPIPVIAVVVVVTEFVLLLPV
jgi:hypothetical protein